MTLGVSSSCPFEERPSSEGCAWRDELVRTHEGLARSLARRFDNRGEDLDDLVQVALLGLVKAADRFDVSMNTRFSTFATATITGELKRHFRDKRWGLHVARSAQERYLLVREATQWARQDLGRTPTTSEIAATAGVRDEEVLEAQQLGEAFRLQSIDALSESGEHNPDVSTNDAALGTIATRLTLESVINELPEQDRRLLRLRFVDELSQSQIAELLDVSQMQISRRLSSILAGLRVRMS
jgi:RNA polymerase sigma-B factor